MAMTSPERIRHWVEQFADSVIQASEALRRNDSLAHNRHAKRITAAFQKLRTVGDPGRDALASLLTHERADVRAMAACHLLRHRTQEALEVLGKEAAGGGLTAFGASEAIKRWEEGDWHLDPQDDEDDLRRLADDYADCIVRQADASHWLASNVHARRGDAVFERLRAFGDAGRDAMMLLLRHPRADVRVNTACYLLTYRTKESLEVLRKEAAGEGFLAFGASQAIKRWEEGNWHLDSDEKGAVGPAEREGAHQDETALVPRDAVCEKAATGVNNVAVTWDRAATDFFGPNPGAGDRAAGAMLLAHGLIMNGGVLNAVEVMSHAQLEAAKAGYRFFGFDGIVDLFSRVKSLLDSRPDAPEEEMELEAEVSPGVRFVYENDLGQFEEQLDSDYRLHIPDDSALEERFQQVLVARPGDFADL
jgi:hypothetical protein